MEWNMEWNVEWTMEWSEGFHTLWWRWFRIQKFVQQAMYNNYARYKAWVHMLPAVTVGSFGSI